MNVQSPSSTAIRALITGGKGFLGAEISRVLLSRGWHITSLGTSLENDIVCDLSQNIPGFGITFDIVIHCAGKAHSIPVTKSELDAFTNVNVEGTRNLIKGLEQSPGLPRSLVFISSIAVYGLKNGDNIGETQRLEATDAYGKSKIGAENLLLDWAKHHTDTSVTILRLPLIANKNPPGNLGAMIRGISTGRYVSIGGGLARKSVVMASDVAALIPNLFERRGIYNLTDGHHPSFRELEAVIARQLKTKHPISIPVGVAKILGLAGDVMEWLMPGKSPVTSDKVLKIISSLTFDDQKARMELGWKPHRVTDVLII